MTAVHELAETSTDDSAPEPAWTHEDFESLSEEQVVGLLLRRMRKLSARGFDPGEALIAASRIGVPIH